MDDQSTSHEAVSSSREKSQITLHILSPSSEVPDRIRIENAPTSTTIGELKRRITDRTPGKVAPDRQRLIYQGRALQNHQTLKETFTQATIEASDNLTLHLAVPPALGASSNPLPSSTPIPAHDTSNLSQGPAGSAPVAPDLSQAQQPAEYIHHPPNGPQITQFQARIGFPAGQVPPNIQEIVNSQLQNAISQQLGAQIPAMVAAQMQAGVQAFQNQQQDQNHANDSHASWQQLQAQQQRARAAAGQNGIGDQTPAPDAAASGDVAPTQRQPSQQNGMFSHQHLQQTQPVPHQHHHHHQSHHHHGLHAAHPGMQRTHTPNGDNVRISIQSTSTFTSPRGTPQPGIPSAFPVPPSHTPPPFPYTQPNLPLPFPPNFQGAAVPHNLPIPRRHSPRPQDSTPTLYLNYQQQLAVLTNMISNGQPPSQRQIESARAALVAIPVANQVGSQGLQLQLDRIAAQAQEMRNNPTSTGPVTTSRQGTTSTSPYTESQTTPSSGPTTVYLLSSPSGPHALLITSTGQFFSNPGPSPWQQYPFAIRHAASTPTPPWGPWTNGVVNAVPPAGLPNPPQRHPSAPSQPTDAQLPPQHQHQHHHHHHHNHNNHHPQQAQAQQGQENNLQNLFNILFPLGGHVWLFIRLFGFVYFFTAGVGFRRALFLGIGALILFILQTGALRPWVTQIWNPVRRHIEGLLPIPQVPAQPPAAAQANAEEAQQGHGTAPEATDATAASTHQATPQTQPRPAAVPTPTPTETAARLLAQRQNPYFALIRDYTRRFERGLALFLGSLIPGFGERHVEAQNAVEAAIAAAERRRTEEREEEERRRIADREANGEAPNAVSETATTRKEEGEPMEGASASIEPHQGPSGDDEGLRRRTVVVNAS